MGYRAGAMPADSGAPKSRPEGGSCPIAPGEDMPTSVNAGAPSSESPAPEDSGSAEVSSGGSVGLEWSAVHLADHDPAWISLFEEEKARIQDAAGRGKGVVCDIQHVGSTAVPGLRAKPVIDIAVGLRSLEDAPALIPQLESIGYENRPEIQIPGELFLRRIGGTHHLHLLQHQSSYWMDYLNFRDHLRQDAGAARRYLELKTALARQFAQDRPSYTRGKAAFIQGILAEAGK